MAVAGFAEHDLDITLHEQVLTITGTQPQDDIGDREVLYRGMCPQFERRFQLDDFTYKIAELQDGLLHIHLVREIPEAMKPRKIAINSADTLVDIKKRKKASLPSLTSPKRASSRKGPFNYKDHASGETNSFLTCTATIIAITCKQP